MLSPSVAKLIQYESIGYVSTSYLKNFYKKFELNQKLNIHRLSVGNLSNAHGKQQERFGTGHIA
jgi:hypothetical protein